MLVHRRCPGIVAGRDYAVSRLRAWATDGWVEVCVRPWPLDRPEERPPIKVRAWPAKEAELVPLADAQAIVDEHDETQR
jgi:hypothetical protein